MKDEVKITVIATGFDRKTEPTAAATMAATVGGSALTAAKLSPQMHDLEIPTFLRRQR